ncbi:MAG: helix-turn-helix transcriptional regulator [Lawsonibacter sp.]|nr:helix-turn-helix transcriptional regulator [Lawsonibacter sp.]
MRQFYKPLNVEIGARIREARESARMTREGFAEKVDISTQFLTDIERGRMGASLETIIKICDTLGVTTDFILRGPDLDEEVTARQLSVLLGSVPRTLLPLVIDNVRDQIRLIETAQGLEKTDRKDN